MDYSIYIIKQNTPESKLLHFSGLNRKELEINKWKGRKQINGGFGRAPVEWKIEGIENVELLCKTIVRILGKRKKLTQEEQKTYDRAEKTLKGIKNHFEKEKKNENLNERKTIKIIALLELIHPSIQRNKIVNFAKEKCNSKALTLENLLGEFNQEMKEVSAINEARREFNKVMKLSD
jgi:hypothetical protein